MMTDTILMGVESGPVSPLQYKRAVLRPPPREFTVEILDPTKQGSSFSYGLKVCPIIRSRNSSDSRSTSSRSTSSYTEYEVWRRWEDCLGFQETLEEEYGKMSRQKVKVLKRGAAGKKRKDESDSLYNLRNAAASFESLPEGPDPREVAVDVHKLIPQLTRKGTLFRVSRSTIKQRGEEFSAMIQALFNASEDAPVLLQELRNCSSVRDFFGIWRRDKDLLKKSGKDVSRLSHFNRSVSSFSTSFSFSTTLSSPASSTFPTTPTSQAASLRHSMFARSGPRDVNNCYADTVASGLAVPASAPPESRRFVPGSPALSHFSTGSQDDRHPETADGSTGSIMFTDELLLQDDTETGVEHYAQHHPFPHVSAPQSAPLFASFGRQTQTHPSTNGRVQESFPECELPRPQPRARSNSTVVPGYRNGRIFMSAPTTPLGTVEYTSHQPEVKPSPRLHPASPLSTQPVRHTSYALSTASSQASSASISASSRPSSMSMNRFSVASSVSSYSRFSKRSSTSHDSVLSDDSESCFDLDITFPNSPALLHTPLSEIAEGDDPGFGHRPRDSASSFASFRTEASADGVLPPHLRLSPAPSRRTRVNDSALVDDSQDAFSAEEPLSDGGDDLLDMYFIGLGEGSMLSMESLDKELPRFIAHGAKHSISSISSTGSFNSGADSQPPWSPRDDAFAVKAVYQEFVVVFRAERNMSLAAVRQKIKDRFTLHECTPLNEKFILAYLPPQAPAANGVVRRGRSNSVASSTSDISRLRLLQTEPDWQAAMTTGNGKVTLRVFDGE